jgi:acetyl esterase/lipase
MVKIVTRLLAILSAISGILINIRLRDGALSFLTWKPKVISEAFSPLLALGGWIGTLLGFRKRDSVAALAGLLGGVLTVDYIRRVSRPHRGFDSAFGRDWRGQIPPTIAPQMMRRRWSPFPPDPMPVPWESDICIATGADESPTLLTDIWLPPEQVTGTGLGVIYLHGSGWHYGSKDTRTRRFFSHLANQGHVIMDLEYTLAPEADIFDMVKEVKAAIGWLKANGKDLGVRPDRIVLMGNSAGGHLALLSAYTPGVSEFDPHGLAEATDVRAVVSYYGPTDLVSQQSYFQRHFANYPSQKGWPWVQFFAQWEKNARRTGFLPDYGRYVSPAALIPDAVSAQLDAAVERFQLASPTHHVGAHCPPTLQLQGAHDFGGMARDARRLHHMLLSHGVPSVYVEFPNTEHAFDLIPSKWSPPTQGATYDTERFLALMV